MPPLQLRARAHGPVEWLEECERRGWRPDEARLDRVLAALAEAIAVRGGQRRARPYLDAQLRRLSRRRPGAARATRRRGRSLVA